MTRRAITPAERALVTALGLHLLAWLCLGLFGAPARLVLAGLLATAMVAGLLRARPTLMRPHADDRQGKQVLKAAWTTLVMSLWLVLVILILLPAGLGATEPASGSAQPDITGKTTEEAGKVIEDSNRNLERYRADIEALIRGTPGFADRQRRLAVPNTLPGNPLAGMEPPASRPGEVLPGQHGTTLMVFLTLSMPDDALVGWIEQTARAGGVAVIRGFYGDKMSTTLKRLAALQEQAPAIKGRGGVSVDPTAFSRFDVDVAPVVIVSSAPLPPCHTNGCAGDPAPPHDRIAGNITLEHALTLLARGGDAAPGTARRHLARLEKGN